ncbi:hypothetical protein [uncultured Phenylobacterium sp.]|uniref:hypothetical protein n=1 Tax=uncultured Phenylobacterium sp. TaxID=349273 RepID=UPI0025DBB429|nr:hypothetical protein [uncultured Phenylobacterium sp.]
MSATVPSGPTEDAGDAGARSYRLVERGAGVEASEVFRAPDDAVALARAQEVAQAEVVELWRDTVMLGRWQGGSACEGFEVLRRRSAG